MSLVRYPVPSYSSPQRRVASIIAGFGLITAAGIITPTPAAATWSVAAPTVVRGGVTLTPSPVSATFSVASPTVLVVSPNIPLYTAGTTGEIRRGVRTFSTAPSSASRTFAQTAQPPTSVIPDAVSATWSVAAPTIQLGGVTLTPTPSVGTFSVATPTISQAGESFPDLVTAGTTPRIRRSVRAFTAPGTLVTSRTIQALTPVASSTLTPAAITATFSVATPSVFTPNNIFPDVHTAGTTGLIRRAPRVFSKEALLAPPTVYSAFSIINTLTPNAVSATWSVPAPLIGRKSLPAAVVATWSIPAPTVVTGGQVLTPSAVTAAWSVATPAVVRGGRTLTPTSVSAAWSISVAKMALVLRPSSVVGIFEVPGPTVQGGAGGGLALYFRYDP